MVQAEVMPLDRIFISPLCSGAISINANVEEASEDIDYPEVNNTAVEFSFSLTSEAGITVPASDRIEFDMQSVAPLMTVTYHSGAVYTGDAGTSDKAQWMKWIPAFYSSGMIRVNAVFMDSDDSANKVDMTFDAFMYIKNADRPAWYPYSLELIDNPLDSSKKMMAYPMDGLITSSGDNIKHETIGDNTNMAHQFSIGAWSSFRPIVADINEDGIKRGFLPPTCFKVTCTNNLASAFRLSSITFSFTFNYAGDGTLMNLGSTYAKDVVQLYCDPKYLTQTEKDTPTSGATRHIWAIVDGFAAKSSDAIDDSEVVRVFGYYKKTDSNGTSTTKTCVHLDMVPETAGTNHPAFVYKSDISTDPISFLDNLRMASNGLKSGEEYASVITPKLICQSDTFKHVDVTCTKIDPNDSTQMIVCNPADKDAEFNIVVKLRSDSVDEIENTVTGKKGVNKADFDRCVKTVKFCNVDTLYTPVTQDANGNDVGLVVKRTNINKIFYDTLSSNFEELVVLESIRGDIEPYALIKINSADNKVDTWIPIYNGKPIQFNESLSRCNDGMRSRDIFYFCEKGGNSPNVIEVGETTQRYRVTIEITYSKYKGMEIHKYVPKVATP